MAKKQVAVGIDIGGTNTVFGFVDREGNILVETGISLGIDLDKPERARKIGNEYVPE